MEHLLTDAERDRFEHDGYLLLPHALDAATVTHLLAVTDRETLGTARRTASGCTTSSICMT